MNIRLARTFLAGVVGLAVLAGASATAHAQAPTTIKGRVMSDAGMPLAGTSVFIDAIKAGAQTGEDGRYTITVAGRYRGPQVLTARRIGYKRGQENITLNGTTINLDFTLQSQAVTLTGMVVTALSQQREKSTIGTSQQQMSNADLNITRQVNVVNSMSGSISGVTIQSSGAPGGSARLVIRGAGSINGDNQPLFIVDGIPVSNAGFATGVGGYSGRDYGSAIADINPEDISSVTVLKGPNAAALYGSRAANGAVVITTRSGKQGGEGINVQFASYLTSDKFSVMPKLQNSYGQGFGGEFQYVDGAGGGINDGADESWGPKLDGRLIDQFTGPQMPWVAHPNNVASYFNTGHSVSNSVSITASGQKMGARVSVTKDNNAGIVPGSTLSRLQTLISASASPTDKLGVSTNVQYTQNEGVNRPQIGYVEGNPFMGFIWSGRQIDMTALKNKYYNADGSLFNWNTNYHLNPYWLAQANSQIDTRDRVIASATVNYQFTDWLKGLVRMGSDQYRFANDQRYAKGDIDYASASYNGGFINTQNRATETNVEALLTAQKSFGQFDVTGNVGANRRRNNSFNSDYRTPGILVEGIYNLANAGIAPTVTNSEFHSGVNSVYGSGVLTWNKVATLEATGRQDNSSTLPKGNNTYFYPSVTGSLLVSDMFPSITKGGFITYLKLRGSYAQVGSDAQAYQLATLYAGDSRKFGGRSLFSLSNTTANPNLKPEKTLGQEGGIELSMFDDKLTVDATYYSKITKDQIIALTVAPATGFSQASINAGQMSNKGIEAQVTYKWLEMRNGLTWKTTVNYTKNKNRVDALAPGLSTIVIASIWSANIEARVGQPYGALFGTAWLRDSVTGKLITSGGLPVPDPVRRVLGNVNPDYTGGIGNDVRYKNWSLNVLFDIRHGGQNFSSGNWFANYSGVTAVTVHGREQDWNKPGLVLDAIDKATGQPNTANVTAEDYWHNTFYAQESGIFNTGFVKLRSVRIGWDAPSKVADQLHLKALNVAFIGKNLATWTKFPNFDPENATGSGNAGQGFDYGALPTTRSLGLNFTITP